MRVLVTGATGLLGVEIVRELASRGHTVRALVRPASPLAGLAGKPAEVVRGDVLDPPSVQAAVAGVEGLVHAAGIPRIGADARETFAVNVHGVEVVLEAARSAGVSRVVVTSSTAVMGGTREPAALDESTPGNAEALGIGYFVSKLRGERVALSFAARGLPVVVVRPSYVLGPGDTHGSSASIVTALARGRLPGWIEGGASFCDVRDVARGHAEALARGRPGEAYVLGGHNLRMSEFVRRTCAAAGVAPPPRIPRPVAYGVAALQEAWAKLGGARPATTRDLVRAAALYTFTASAKAERELGYTVRPFDEMLADTLRWALEAGRLRAETDALRALGRAGARGA
jgi:dihydroflavonol-4-reductase